jgi:hypothetical protein
MDMQIIPNLCKSGKYASVPENKVIRIYILSDRSKVLILRLVEKLLGFSTKIGIANMIFNAVYT